MWVKVMFYKIMFTISPSIHLLSKQYQFNLIASQ